MYILFSGKKTDVEVNLTDENKEKIYKFIENSLSSEIEIVSILLFGGEPLLYFEDNIAWLDKIKALCEKENKKLVTSIVAI